MRALWSIEPYDMHNCKLLNYYYTPKPLISHRASGKFCASLPCYLAHSYSVESFRTDFTHFFATDGIDMRFLHIYNMVRMIFELSQIICHSEKEEKDEKSIIILPTRTIISAW